MVKELLKLPNVGCIYALYNQKRKKTQLFLANSNALLSIPRTISNLRNNDHKSKELCSDINDLELIVLETHEDTSYLRLRMQYWYDYVEDLGLETYTKRIYLQYKSRINVDFDYTGEKRVLVELVNKRNESFVVGVFDKMYEAKEFQEAYFGRSKYVYPIYANNVLTREYIQTRDKQLDRVFKVRF